MKDIILNYWVISTSDFQDFLDTVNMKIDEGYQPQGGVSVSQVGFIRPDGEEITETLYSQAMIYKA